MSQSIGLTASPTSGGIVVSLPNLHNVFHLFDVLMNNKYKMWFKGASRNSEKLFDVNFWQIRFQEEGGL